MTYNGTRDASIWSNLCNLAKFARLQRPVKVD
jgi:hypothetical protein